MSFSDLNIISILDSELLICKKAVEHAGNSFFCLKKYVLSDIK